MPEVDLKLAPQIFQRLHEAIQRGLICSCHDVSEGGLAAAVAEMALAGDVGADLTGVRPTSAEKAEEIILFSESATRFVVEVAPANEAAFRDCIWQHLPLCKIGQTCKERRLRMAGAGGTT